MLGAWQEVRQIRSVGSCGWFSPHPSLWVSWCLEQLVSGRHGQLTVPQSPGQHTLLGSSLPCPEKALVLGAKLDHSLLQRLQGAEI
jgi:hypothetical protein